MNFKKILANILNFFLISGMLAIPMQSFALKQNKLTALNLNSDFKIANHLEIELPKEPTQHEIEAALLLFKYLNKASDKLEISIKYGASDAQKIISISKDKNAKIISPLLKDFSNVRKNTIEVSRNRINISYSFLPQNAVGDFLNFLGYKFFAPSDLGTEVPAAENLKLKSGKYVFEPDFVSSQIFSDIPDHPWFKLIGNGVTIAGRVHFLKNFFTAEVYKKHPEFAPTPPLFMSQNVTQPKFQAKGISEFTYKAAIRFFEENPNSTAVSIGMNDSPWFDRDTKTNPPPNEIFRNYLSYSNTYFAFANLTAKLLQISNPEKFVITLAYYNLENAPDFKLSPNIVPFLTSDRANYFDTNYKNEDFALLKRWENSGIKVLAIYDYNFGRPYYVPRNIEDYIWEGITEAKKLKIAKAYFGESNPIWAYDAAKIWVLSRLINGDKRSPQELETEFYKSIYPTSHKEIFKFFTLSKSAWKNRSSSTSLLAFIKKYSVAEIFSDAILQEMEKTLKAAESLDTKGKETLRIAQIRLCFEASKAFCRCYKKTVELYKLPSNAKASEILRALEDSLNADKNFQESIIKQKECTLYNDSLETYVKEFVAPLDSLILSILKNGSSEEISKLKTLVSEEDYTNVQKLLGKQKLIGKTKFEYPNYASNTPSIQAFPPNFRQRILPDRNADFRIVKNEKEYFARIANCTHAELSKFSNVKENRVYSLIFDLDYKVPTEAYAYLKLFFLDAQNKVIKEKYVNIPNFKNAENRQFLIIDKAPKNSVKAGQTVVVTNIRGDNFIHIKEIKFEEAED